MLNCAIIMGRLTADPELRKTPSNLSVTSFTVAVDRKYNKDEEKIADFINVVAWRGSADFVCKYFKKGQMIAVQGEIQTRSYDDKDGIKRWVTEIIADNVSFCGSKSNGTTQTENIASMTPAVDMSQVANDDEGLPF